MKVIDKAWKKFKDNLLFKPEWRMPRRPPKQKKSLEGQKMLFDEDVDGGKEPSKFGEE